MISTLQREIELVGDKTCFRLPRLFLLRPEVDLAKWAVIVCSHCDEREAGNVPSTLR